MSTLALAYASTGNPTIDTLIDRIETTGLTVTVDDTNAADVVVQVSGSPDSVSKTLNLVIPVGVTVEWGSFYVGTIPSPLNGPLISFSGEGTFKVVEGAWIWNEGSGNAINAAGARVVVTGGGVVEATSGTAIYGTGLDTVVIVEDRGSVMNEATSNLHPVINMVNSKNVGDYNVIVDGGAVWAMAELHVGYAIQTYGNVLVKAGEVHSESSNGRAINLIGSTSVANIYGGKVWADGDNGVAISTATTNSEAVANAGVNVYGGIVSATSNFAIHVTGTHSFVNVEGGVVSATSANAIRADKAGSSVSISGGFVFAYGTGITGTNNVIHIVGGGEPVIGGDAVVVAWDRAGNPGPFDEYEEEGLIVEPTDLANSVVGL